MNKLFLILATFFTLSAKSQTSVYHPFPEDTASWVSDIYYNTCMGYCGTSYYEMKGDTSINGESYNKIYYRGGQFYYVVPPPNTVIGSNFSQCSFVGAIRQDTANKKVYFIDSTMTADTLLYDFDLAIGDTIQSWYNKEYMQWPLIVSGIDSISVNGTFRKKYYFQNYPSHRNLVEGVGWSGELFGITEFALEVVLTCFNGSNNINPGWMAFVNECGISLDCSIYLDINELHDENNFSLFPNPFSSEVNINVNNNEVSEVIIYDMTSRIILKQEFQNYILLNTQEIPTGFYFYKIWSKNGLLSTGKIVKE